MLRYTFHTLVGSRVQKINLTDVGEFRNKLAQWNQLASTEIETTCCSTIQMVETKDAFYLCRWSHAVTVPSQLDAETALLVQSKYWFGRAASMIKPFLQPLGLWCDGDFGVWSFVVNEGVGEPEVSRPESICILCREERPLEKTISEYPLLKLCCTCFDNFQTLTRLTCKDVDDFSVIGTFRSDHCSLLRTANAKIDKERKKRVCAALQYGKQHWGSKT